MTASLLHGGRDLLQRLFEEVAEEFNRSGIDSEVLMVGGSWMLWFGLRDSTRDVDSARTLPAEAASAIAGVAGRHDLARDWLNDSATAFLPFGFDSTSCMIVYASESLQRSQIPDWFDGVRSGAEEIRRAAQQQLDGRDSERAAAAERASDARRALPAAAAAHTPFEKKVVAAERVVSEAGSDLWSAENELRTSGRVHRRTARRNVETSTDVLAVANERLARVEELAAPTRAR